MCIGYLDAIRINKSGFPIQYNPYAQTKSSRGREVGVYSLYSARSTSVGPSGTFSSVTTVVFAPLCLVVRRIWGGGGVAGASNEH
jgi:hypothetical protein